MMKSIGLLLAALVALNGQTPSSSTAPVRHLEYQFGFNTKAASSGQGTGTTAIDILGPAPDGGLMVSGSDFWWNTVRPRAANVCEVYPTGKVSCSKPPYAISPIQVSIFPLLARDYFKGLSAAGTSSWTQTYKMKGTVLPGVSAGFAGQVYTWDCVYNLQGKGPIPNAAGIILVESKGTVQQEGGRFRKGTAKVTIAYDPAAKIPVAIDDLRTHLPQSTVYNNDFVQLKLLKDSGASQ